MHIISRSNLNFYLCILNFIFITQKGVEIVSVPPPAHLRACRNFSTEKTPVNGFISHI